MQIPTKFHTIALANMKTRNYLRQELKREGGKERSILDQVVLIDVQESVKES